MITDDIAKRARDEAERMLACWHSQGPGFCQCPETKRPAVAAYIEGLMRDRQHWAELMGEQARRRIDESNARVAAEQQLADAQREIGLQKTRALIAEATVAQGWSDRYADAQREIERLKAAAWATLTIADMTVPQIVAMKQENAALRQALEEIKRDHGKVCANFELCKHPSCASSHAAWEIANAALEQKP